MSTSKESLGNGNPDSTLPREMCNGHIKKESIILNAFVANSPGHLSPGLWRHPKNNTTEYNKLKFWIDLAQLLDKANFHSLFVADILGPYDVYKGPANHGPALSSGTLFPINDPLYLVPAMAAIEHDERYRIAEEYMDVVYGLWEGSWRDDAVVKDLKTGQYAVPERVREINHKGKYFDVPGPHLCEPSRQRTPFLFQAGTSKSGREFGAKHAEAIFVEGQTAEKVRVSVDTIKQLAKEKFGRNPDHIKFVAAVTVIVAETDEDAKLKRDEFLSYTDREGGLVLFGGWTGTDMSTYSDDEDFRFVKMPSINSIIDGWSKTVPGSEDLKWNKSTIAEYLSLGGIAPKFIGSAKTVADEMERWMDIAGIDGFNLYNLTNPGSFEDIIEFVIPELQSRGIFRSEVTKEGATARETYLGEGEVWLLDDHPGRKHRWVADAAGE